MGSTFSQSSTEQIDNNILNTPEINHQQKALAFNSVRDAAWILGDADADTFTPKVSLHRQALTGSVN